MRWGKTHKERDSRKHAWIDWYAWHPVRLLNGQWAWLENVQRKRRNEHGEVGPWEYI